MGNDGLGAYKMKSKKSYLVIGMGRFGKSIATELHEMKHEVLVIDE